jgi:hypothetical protein
MAVSMDPYSRLIYDKQRERTGGKPLSPTDLEYLGYGVTSAQSDRALAGRSQALAEKSQAQNFGLATEKLAFEKEAYQQGLAQQKTSLLTGIPMQLATIDWMTKGKDSPGVVRKAGEWAYDQGKEAYGKLTPTTAASQGPGPQTDAALEHAASADMPAYAPGGSDALSNADALANIGVQDTISYSDVSSAYGGMTAEAAAEAGSTAVEYIPYVGWVYKALSTLGGGNPEVAVRGAGEGIEKAGQAVGEIGEGVTSGAVFQGFWEAVTSPFKETVICSELARQGLVPWSLVDAEHRYHGAFSPQVYQGYLLWARPVVRGMQRSALLTKLVAPFGRAFLREVASRVEGGKGSFLGKLLISIGVPICAALGRAPEMEVA